MAIGPMRETGALYFLCWVLVTYGECLFELGRLAEAQNANKEGGQIAAEVGRDYYLLMSLLLEARLDAAQCGDVTVIGAGVEALHERFHETGDMTAEIDYSLWQITGDTAVDARTAAGFRRLDEETKRERFRVRMK